MGQHCTNAWSKTQSLVATSSGEAELYAMTGACSEALGLVAMGRDFGENMRPVVHVDASAAIGIAQRKGLGKVRHLDTQSLWIHDALRERRLFLHKVPGKEGPGDMMTKPPDGKSLAGLMARVGLVVLEGGPKAAPQLTRDYGGGHHEGEGGEE